jgi:crotonobetainyl-CoA:carnitine CoA-transferase CaiB-like acyl-CoA transferase
MRPLEDLRVVAVEQYGAGPFGSLHLADLGAEIIKIEDPRFGGDVGRYVPPFQEGEDSLFYETFNRNKRSMSLDISTAAGRRVFEDLVASADAVYSNLRGDVPARLRLRYEDLQHVNPRIVCVSVSGFGMSGPRAKQPGYDYVLQGLAGWMSVTGEPGGPPTKTGLSLVDYSGGYVAAIALLAAVHAARRDGVGTDCDISLYDVAISLLTYPATWHLNQGWEPKRTSRSAHPSLVPFQAFQGSDGRWFVVGCAKEYFWDRLAEVIDRPELADDPRFHDFAARGRHKDELISILDDVFATQPSTHWIEKLEETGVPTGPVQTVADAMTEPHTAARQLIVETEHPRWGTVQSLASPVRVGDADRVSYRRAPLRNEDASYVLKDLLQYDAQTIEDLANAGAFGEEASRA